MIRQSVRRRNWGHSGGDNKKGKGRETSDDETRESWDVERDNCKSSHITLLNRCTDRGVSSHVRGNPLSTSE